MLTPLASLADLTALYAGRGREHYGEGLSQNDHAVQCATLAHAAGAVPALVAAALLHDVGHLLAGHGEGDHAAVGAAALAVLFGPDVWRPVALHVAAKRYLCATEPTYAAALSAESRHSLARQGGPFDVSSATAFAGLPDAGAAIALRRWDDHGKDERLATGGFAGFLPLLAGLATR